MMEYLRASADPDAARANYERFLEAGGAIPVEASQVAFANIFGGSPFLSSLLIRDPELAGWLANELTATSTRTRGQFLGAARIAMESGILELHRFQRREILRIGARDLSGQTEMRQLTQELSWLADAIIQMAVDQASRELTERLRRAEIGFAVIGMGKLGGEELNFSSDVDLIYIFSDEHDKDDAEKLARRVTQILTEPTGEGTFYRVDLRLRPEGSRGPVASSLSVLETYYESWGETFERFALTKARVVAGDEDTGRRFVEFVQPFVYRKYLDLAAIDEVRDIKMRIDQQIRKSVGSERHIKLGWGGIRELEFFAQALQILYGGENPLIRVPNTLDALDRLEQADIIGADVARRLRDAYIFLRNVEHKLQIVHQLQTHEIPSDSAELRKCALRMHMSPEEFQVALQQHRDAVHRIFQELFAGKAPVEDGVAAEVHRFLNRNMETEAAREWLRSLRFQDPVQSVHNLELLRDAPAFGHSSMRMKNLLSNILTPLIDNATHLVRPDTVLNGFEKIVSGVGAREGFFMSLLENPKSLYRLVRLLSLSDYLSEILFESPEVIDFLIDDSLFNRRLRRPMPTDQRKIQEFYIGAQYFFGTLLRRHASRVLSRFAEREITKALPPGLPIAIFAAGKFGEREMNFRSDLDVIAFYEGEHQSARATIEELLVSMSGQFKMDMRLRPEGTKGSLVWNPEHYREYLHDRGETWERMALTKARFVTGDRKLGATIQEIIESFVYDQPFGRPQIEEMNQIRWRMERELARESGDARDVKLGRGGIVDIEFMVEYRQIRDNVRIPNTVLAMKRLGPALLQEYEFLRHVQSMLRLWSSLATTRIEAKDREALGLMLHIRDFEAEYRRVTGEVRRQFETEGRE